MEYIKSRVYNTTYNHFEALIKVYEDLKFYCITPTISFKNFNMIATYSFDRNIPFKIISNLEKYYKFCIPISWFYSDEIRDYIDKNNNSLSNYLLNE